MQRRIHIHHTCTRYKIRGQNPLEWIDTWELQVKIAQVRFLESSDQRNDKTEMVKVLGCHKIRLDMSHQLSAAKHGKLIDFASFSLISKQFTVSHSNSCLLHKKQAARATKPANSQHGNLHRSHEYHGYQLERLVVWNAWYHEIHGIKMAVCIFKWRWSTQEQTSWRRKTQQSLTQRALK